ncbi:hypothetical protein DFJ73DRAFT_54673 [Zopfochytrium polystomum]|nr:hypothetical protein DFJ73DRAFT_54673 [Zopfochytrium polystomum]
MPTPRKDTPRRYSPSRSRSRSSSRSFGDDRYAGSNADNSRRRYNDYAEDGHDDRYDDRYSDRYDRTNAAKYNDHDNEYDDRYDDHRDERLEGSSTSKFKGIESANRDSGDDEYFDSRGNAESVVRYGVKGRNSDNYDPPRKDEGYGRKDSADTYKKGRRHPEELQNRGRSGSRERAAALAGGKLPPNTRSRSRNQSLSGEEDDYRLGTSYDRKNSAGRNPAAKQQQNHGYAEERTGITKRPAAPPESSVDTVSLARSPSQKLLRSPSQKAPFSDTRKPSITQAGTGRKESADRGAPKSATVLGVPKQFDYVDEEDDEVPIYSIQPMAPRPVDDRRSPRRPSDDKPTSRRAADDDYFGRPAPSPPRGPPSAKIPMEAGLTRSASNHRPSDERGMAVIPLRPPPRQDHLRGGPPPPVSPGGGIRSPPILSPKNERYEDIAVPLQSSSQPPTPVLSPTSPAPQMPPSLPMPGGPGPGMGQRSATQPMRRGNTTRQGPPGPVLVPSTPRSSSHPKALFNQPPSKVIKAISDYRAKTPSELSFRNGDFFYVVSESEFYFEVTNPAEKRRGQVPKDCFESLERAAQRINERAREAAMDPTGPPLRVQAPPHIIQSSSAPPISARSSPLSPRSGSSNTPPNISPTGPVARAQTGGGVGPVRPINPSSITAVTVTNVELRGDNLQWFTIECHQIRDAGPPFVLFRTHDDFWALQVALLSLYPREAGHGHSGGVGDGGTAGRVIPFLPAPSRDFSLGATSARRMQLEAYLQELIRAFRSSRALSDAGVARRFFSVRPAEKGDVDDATVRELGLGEMPRMDERVLAAAGGQPGTVKVRINMGKEKGLIAVRVQDTIRFNRLLDIIEDECRRTVYGVSFMDETNSLIRLRGDDDLRLIIRTNPLNLMFFPSYS